MLDERLDVDLNIQCYETLQFSVQKSMICNF